MLKRILVLPFLMVFLSASSFAGSTTDSVNNTNKTPAAEKETIYDGANKGKGMEILGAATNAAAAAMYFGRCTPKTYYYCVMGALSAAQAAMTMAGAGQSGNVANTTDWNSPYDAATDVDLGCWADNSCNSAEAFGGVDRNAPAPPPYGTVGGIIDEIDKQKLNMNKSGIKLDMKKQTLTDANGNEQSFGGAGAGAMASGGAEMAQIQADVNAYAKKHSKNASKYGVSSMGYASGGGGGSFSGKSSFESDNSLADYLKQLRGKNGRQPSSVAGLKKMIDGEPIGVSGDNIFQMVHRRYQDKRSQKIFLENKK